MISKPVTRVFPRAISLAIILTTSLALSRAAEEAKPATAPLPAAVFFEPLRFVQPKLSPDGTKVCALTRYDDTRYELTLIELPSKKSSCVVRGGGMSIVWFEWKTDDLIFMLVKGDDGSTAFRSLDLKTSKVNDFQWLRRYWLGLLNTLPLDPEHMLFAAGYVHDHVAYLDVIKLNIRTGEEKRVEDSQPGINIWLADRMGKVAFGGGEKSKDDYFLLWRASADAKWQRRVFKPLEMKAYAVAPDQRRLIVADYRHDSTGRLVYYDPATEDVEEIAAAQQSEPQSIEYWGSENEPSAAVYETDREIYRYLDPRAEAARAWLQEAIPGSTNTFLSFSRENRRAIVLTASDRNPGRYIIADFDKKELTLLGPVSKFINPAAMGTTRHFEFETGDGLHVTGRITLPNGIAHPPLVVRVGPRLDGDRSTSRFDFVAQYLASRGYASVIINHRGTAGFDRAFTQAGDFQMKTGMGDDIVAGVNWLKSQGWVDADRIALATFDDGGLIGWPLAARPGPFKAFVNFDSPIKNAGATLRAFAPSGRTENELVAAIGGDTAASAFLKSARSISEIDQLSIPSIHCYSYLEPRTPKDDVRALEAALKRRGGTHEVIKGRTTEALQKEKLAPWQDQIARFEAAVAFLNRHLSDAK